MMSAMRMVSPWVMRHPAHTDMHGGPSSSLGSCGQRLCAVPSSIDASDGSIGTITSIGEDTVQQSSDGENGGFQETRKV